MEKQSKTPGVPRRERHDHKHPGPAPGGLLRADENADEKEETPPACHTLDYLIEILKQMRQQKRQ